MTGYYFKTLSTVLGAVIKLNVLQKQLKLFKDSGNIDFKEINQEQANL